MYGEVIYLEEYKKNKRTKEHKSTELPLNQKKVKEVLNQENILHLATFKSISLNTKVDILTPWMSIEEYKFGYMVSAELPGINKDSVRITVLGEFIFLIAEKIKAGEAYKLKYEKNYQGNKLELFYGSILLPEDANIGFIEARLLNEVLNIYISK